MCPEAVWTLRRVSDDWFASMTHPFRGAATDACASLSFCAHSSQHTSTILPPSLTLMEFSSSSQSQAAQVFCSMTSLSSDTPVGMRAVGHPTGEQRCQNL